MIIDKQSVLKEAERIEEEVIGMRRRIHRYPEVSFQECETTEFISSKLSDFGVEHEKGIGTDELIKKESQRVEVEYNPEYGATGVIGTIDGDKAGETVALRADIDALPMSESTEDSHLPSREGFRSEREGVMHACGHDAHTAILLGVAKILSDNRDLIKGKVKLVFQPAEEKGAGAKLVLKSNELDGVAAIFGTHVWSPLRKGEVMVNSGPVMAAADKWKLTVKGGGGHGSAPWETDDPLSVMADIINKLYKMMDRKIDARDPAVLSVCKLNSGTVFNIIPDSARAEGTLRTFDSEVREEVLSEASKIFQSISGLNDMKCNFTVKPTMEFPLKNPDKEASFVRTNARNLFKNEDVVEGKPVLAAEDFAYYLAEIPGAFFLLGTGTEGIDKPHHSPTFDVNESVLKKGVAIQVYNALKYLEDF